MTLTRGILLIIYVCVNELVGWLIGRKMDNSIAIGHEIQWKSIRLNIAAHNPLAESIGLTGATGLTPPRVEETNTPLPSLLTVTERHIITFQRRRGAENLNK